MSTEQTLSGLARLVEELPGRQGLFSINTEQVIAPGQWLESEGIKYPIFHYKNEQAQFLAPLKHPLPNRFQLAGQPIELPDDDTKILLLAENQAIPLVLFLIIQLQQLWGKKKLQQRMSKILLASKNEFPFFPVPSRFMIPRMPVGTIASTQLLEDLALPARLASGSGAAGCFDGSLSSLLEEIYGNDYLESNTLVVAIGTNQLSESIKKLLGKNTTKQLFIHFE
ncbi:MAG: hypothetical protein COA74_05505 [Gammaproteobacteria bacterium]|nr:MAG: hypothetical protein COA74_05505 [Gammaproteobacteria bacterium]